MPLHRVGTTPARQGDACSMKSEFSIGTSRAHPMAAPRVLLSSSTGRQDGSSQGSHSSPRRGWRPKSRWSQADGKRRIPVASALLVLLAAAMIGLPPRGGNAVLTATPPEIPDNLQAGHIGPLHQEVTAASATDKHSASHAITPANEISFASISGCGLLTYDHSLNPDRALQSSYEHLTLKRIVRCLDLGFDPNVRYSRQYTPLHYFVSSDNKNAAVIDVLIATGADPNAVTEFGDTPLHLAATYNKHFLIIQTLLAVGSEPNARNSRENTPLHLAVRGKGNKTTAIVEALLAAGADPNARDEDEWTPLHDAAGNSDLASHAAHAAVLLAAGADPNARSEREQTPLHVAATRNAHPDIVGTLVAAGADPNARDEDERTPFHDAAEGSYESEFVSALLAVGADPDARDKEELTPLHVAAGRYSYSSIVAALIEASAEIDARDIYGRTPLHLAAEEGDELKIVEALIAADADPNARDNRDRTPLHSAALSTGSDGGAIVEILLAAGADAHARDDDLRIPWDTAKNNETLKETRGYRALREVSIFAD